MGLETPLALLGLLAAVLPWLAHRVKRRDLVPSPLPTLALLRKADARKRRSRGLTDIVLLALRVAIVIAASMALAAPYAVARLSFGDGRVASAVIVVDDSLSMMRRQGGETLLQRAIERTRQAISSLPEGSEVALVAAGRPARMLARRSTDLISARAQLERLPRRSVRGPGLEGALALAAEQIRGGRHAARRVLVLSDFAGHTGLTPEQTRIEGAQVVLERLGAMPPPANVYFGSVRALPDPSAPSQTSIAIELASSGEVPERVPVLVQASGRELARVAIQLEHGRARQVIAVPTPAPDGDPTASVHIDASDALDADDTAGVLLRPSDIVHVMLVNGDPHPASDRDELHYALRALSLASGSEGTFHVRAVDENALSKYDLAQVDVVVLANTEAPDARDAQRLLHFVQQGGGLIVAGGDHVQPHAYNAALGPLLPCRIEARAEGAEIGLAPPSPSKLFPPGPSGLEQVRARKRLMLECDGEVALRFSDGVPALAQATIGRGRSALLGVSLDADFSDLPLRPGYLPLLARLIRDVAGAGRAITSAVVAGSVVEVAVPPGATKMEIVTPDGERLRFDDLQNKSSITVTQTETAGPYRVLAAGARGLLADVPRGSFVVEGPRAESDLTPISDLAVFGASNARAASAGAVRHPLGSYVLLAFALLALCEGLVRLRAR